ncbi:MAG: molecular chaperone TorD family protein [Coriobacteriales bacterium]|jgi:TorA maturation chaperone TorD|nr:molecular chaperone TorD family protein [Coriobacteriales bacterium]
MTKMAKKMRAVRSKALLTAEQQELINLIEQRAATYGLLSRFYYKEVDQDFLNELKEARYPANTGNPSVDKGYLLIVTYLSNIWENSLNELAVDFVKTFIGSGSDAYSAAFPFESVHTSERRLLMQDARDEVLAQYRRAGLAKQSLWKESEDHISAELEYMFILCNRTVEALSKGDEDEAYSLLVSQLDFLTDHLYAWTPMLTSEMRRFAQTDFYQGLAWLTDGFLETDFEFLEDIFREE